MHTLDSCLHTHRTFPLQMKEPERRIKGNMWMTSIVTTAAVGKGFACVRCKDEASPTIRCTRERPSSKSFVQSKASRHHVSDLVKRILSHPESLSYNVRANDILDLGIIGQLPNASSS